MITFKNLTKVLFLGVLFSAFAFSAKSQTITVTNYSQCDFAVGVVANSSGNACFAQEASGTTTIAAAPATPGASTSTPLTLVAFPGGTPGATFRHFAVAVNEFSGAGTTASDVIGTPCGYPMMTGTGTTGCPTFTVTFLASGNVEIN